MSLLLLFLGPPPHRRRVCRRARGRHGRAAEARAPAATRCAAPASPVPLFHPSGNPACVRLAAVPAHTPTVLARTYCVYCPPVAASGAGSRIQGRAPPPICACPQMAWTSWSESCAACACWAASPTLPSPPLNRPPRRLRLLQPGTASQQRLLPLRQREQRLERRRRRWTQTPGQLATTRQAWMSRRQLSSSIVATRRQRRRRLQLQGRMASSRPSRLLQQQHQSRGRRKRRRKGRRWFLKTRKLRATLWSV